MPLRQGHRLIGESLVARLHVAYRVDFFGHAPGDDPDTGRGGCTRDRLPQVAAHSEDAVGEQGAPGSDISDRLGLRWQILEGQSTGTAGHFVGNLRHAQACAIKQLIAHAVGLGQRRIYLDFGPDDAGQPRIAGSRRGIERRVTSQAAIRGERTGDIATALKGRRAIDFGRDERGAGIPAGVAFLQADDRGEVAGLAVANCTVAHPNISVSGRQN